MPCSWEGNRRSLVALAVSYRLQWCVHLRGHGLRKGYEHPAHGVWHTLLAAAGVWRLTADLSALYGGRSPSLESILATGPDYMMLLVALLPSVPFTHDSQSSITPSVFHSRLKTSLFCKSFPPTDSPDSPDCLLILLSISVFFYFLFFFQVFVVVSSV